MTAQRLPDSPTTATLHIPAAWFRSLVRRIKQAPHLIATGDMGVSPRTDTACDLFVRSLELVPGQDTVRSHPQGHDRYVIAFVPHTVERGGGAWHSLAWMFRLEEKPPYPSLGLIQLGTAAETGTFTGIYTAGDRIIPIRQLHLVGAGMARFDAIDFRQSDPGPPESDRWSRLIGALGGPRVWQRLTSLSIAVVGIGRTGSLVAAALARSGCRQIKLIDPDSVEPPNLDAMDLVTPSDLGSSKAAAVAQHMRALNAQLDVVSLPTSVFSHDASAALKTADVMICTVDDPGARLFTGALATTYLKPWVDIGTGIFRWHVIRSRLTALNTPHLLMGADVRLILPGDGCVLCFGGVAHLPEVLQTWGQPVRRPWQTERAGSLRSLNMLAVATGLRWLEELVMGRLTRSVWQRAEVTTQGLVEWHSMSPRRDPACLLCAATGSADVHAAGNETFP